MFFITIRSYPKKREGKLRKVGGAYVNCWIDFKSQWGAEELAKAAIRHSGWTPRKVTEIKVKTLRNTDKKSKRFFKEAKKFGFSFAYYMWPVNAPDHKMNYDSA